MASPEGNNFSFHKLYQKRHITVPEYQRPYDWKNQTIEQLLISLSEHIKENPSQIQKNPYFLGNLMIHSDSTDNDWKLVDGQQRLVSLTIIASAIRDLFIENGNYKMAYDLHWKVIAKKGSEENYLTPRDTEKKDSPKLQLNIYQAPTGYKGVIKFNLIQ